MTTRAKSPRKLPITDPIQRAIHLLGFARKHGFRIGPTLQVGDVIMQVEDIRQARIEGRGDDAAVPTDTDFYTEAGAVDAPAEGTGG